MIQRKNGLLFAEFKSSRAMLFSKWALAGGYLALRERFSIFLPSLLKRFFGLHQWKAPKAARDLADLSCQVRGLWPISKFPIFKMEIWFEWILERKRLNPWLVTAWRFHKSVFYGLWNDLGLDSSLMVHTSIHSYLSPEVDSDIDDLGFLNIFR